MKNMIMFKKDGSRANQSLKVFIASTKLNIRNNKYQIENLTKSGNLDRIPGKQAFGKLLEESITEDYITNNYMIIEEENDRSREITVSKAFKNLTDQKTMI